MKFLTGLLFVGLALFAMVLLLVVIVAWPPQMGLAFTGGVRLVYEVDLDALEDDQEAEFSLATVDMSQLVRALTNRINPSGTKEIIIRRCDEWRVEIVVPKLDAIELERIKRLVSTAGCLEFHIVAKRGHAQHEFSMDEVDFIVNVLQAGTLPVALRDAPISETAVPSDEAPWQTTRLIVWIMLGALLSTWLLMLLRYGVMGAGGSMASLLQLLLMLAVVELIHVTVTVPLIYASAAVLLLAVVGSVVICESVHRRIRDEPTSPGQVWRSFSGSAVPFAIVLGSLWFAGVAVYAVGSFPLRSVAVPVVIGSMAALATSCFCLLLPVGLVASRYQTATASRQRCETFS